MPNTRVLAIASLATLLFSSVAAAQDPTFYSRDYYPRIKLVFESDDWHQQLQDNRRTGVYVPADMVLDGVLYPQVGVEHKGDSSYSGKLRESTKITTDAFIPGQTVFGYDIITLDACRQSSIFNEVAALFVLNGWSDGPLANIANLECGTETDMKKLGVFTNTERVDSNFFDAHFGSRGHRYTSRGYQPFKYRGSDYQDYEIAYYGDGGDLADLFHDVRDASIALENADGDTVRALMDQYAETEACMRLLVGHKMVAGWDSLEDGNNYYLCEEERHDSRIVPVLWDLDLTWEVIEDPVSFKIMPLETLFESTAQMQRAQTMVRHYLDGPLEGPKVKKLLEQLKAQALTDLLGSPWDDFDDEADVDAAIGVILDKVRGVRSRWGPDSRFNREMPSILVFEPEPPSPVEGEQVWITAQVQIASAPVDEVLLWSRTRGAFTAQAMYDDGAHRDGQANDGVWGAALPLAAGGELQEYYVEARPADLTLAHYGFEPRHTEFLPLSVYVRVPEGGTLLLNELVSDNQSGDQDESGDYDDWLELTNLTAQDHDLSGAWLTDDRNQPRKWSFPDGTLVPAGGYLRVWCDDEEGEGPLHANFRLSSAGETVRLTSSDATGNVALDEVSAPALEENGAWGRVPDGGRYWFHVAKPTGEDAVAPAGKDNGYHVRQHGSASGFRLNADGDLEVGGQMRFELRDGPPDSLAVLYITLGADRVDARPRGWIVVDLSVKAVARLTLDSAGDADLQFKVPDIAAGLRVHAQALALQADFSNGVVLTIEG